MTALVDAYDVVGFDLDGVIYRGLEAVPHAVTTIHQLQRRGLRVGFVTNNAARSPMEVAAHLNRLGIKCTPNDVVTSAQATAQMMSKALPPGSQVLILGSKALRDEIAAVGLGPVTVRSSATAAVCVGFEPSLTWDDLNQGCFAIQAGSVWYTCNDDLNRPTAEGIAIGMGGILKAMKEALPGQAPIMAGKPARPLLDETLRRLGGTKPLFVGDRLDTDIEGANNANWDSLFVLSGSHSLPDLHKAPASQQPTYVGQDLRALLEAPMRYEATDLP